MPQKYSVRVTFQYTAEWKEEYGPFDPDIIAQDVREDPEAYLDEADIVNVSIETY